MNIILEKDMKKKSCKKCEYFIESSKFCIKTGLYIQEDVEKDMDKEMCELWSNI